MGAAVFVRVLWYRDDRGRQRPVRVESADPADLERVAALYAGMERASLRREEAWRAAHGTFADLPRAVDPDSLAEAAGARPHNAGFPWEGPRFEFALLLGEGPTWPGPEARVECVAADGAVSVYGVEAVSPATCRVCGGVAELSPLACCLSCCRTGRDLAIPRPTPWDRKRREEPKPAATKLPAAKRDRAGRTLAGGLTGKR